LPRRKDGIALAVKFTASALYLRLGETGMDRNGNAVAVVLNCDGRFIEPFKSDVDLYVSPLAMVPTIDMQ
jgi:hypothetical protein